MTDASPVEVAGGDVASPQRRVNGHGRANRVRKPTATSRFGVSRRESHDSSEFYQRFPAPEISHDDDIVPPAALDRIWVGDARSMDEFGAIADGSVALVVTSPPYYAGKEYEAAVGEGHIPASYIAYVEMLRDVFAECKRKLQPGGRIAVNVANLGRRPYRSLAADVIGVLQDLRFLIRGEIVWVKGKAAGGSCAWGSFQSPASPVLRDVSERIVVASNGRFDRARSARQRHAAGLPSVATISADEFMGLTTDVWEFPPESATRVGHPAPFPVELPRRLIDLYTYEGELVLDPFMGVGSTAVAARRAGRHFVGFDTDPQYVARALARVEADEREGEGGGGGVAARAVRLPAVAEPATEPEPVTMAEPATEPVGPTSVGSGVVPGGEGSGRGHDATAVSATVLAAGGFEAVESAVRRGRKISDVAEVLITAAGFRAVESKVKLAPGVDVSFRARDAAGATWCFDVVGTFASGNPGLRRAETLWRALGKASVLAANDPGIRLVLLTVETPEPKSATGRALAAVVGSGPGHTVTDVVRLCHPDDQRRLRAHAVGAASPG